MNSSSFSLSGSFRLLAGGQMNSFSAEAFDNLHLSRHVQAGWVGSRRSLRNILYMFLSYTW